MTLTSCLYVNDVHWEGKKGKGGQNSRNTSSQSHDGVTRRKFDLLSKRSNPRHELCRCVCMRDRVGGKWTLHAMLWVDPRVTTLREIWSYPHSQLVQNQMVKKNPTMVVLLCTDLNLKCRTFVCAFWQWDTDSAILLFTADCSITTVALANQSLLVGVKHISTCAPNTRCKNSDTTEKIQYLSGGDRLNQHCVNLFCKMFIYT